MLKLIFGAAVAALVIGGMAIWGYGPSVRGSGHDR